jgi:hypothetical protein
MTMPTFMYLCVERQVQYQNKADEVNFLRRMRKMLQKDGELKGRICKK